MLEVSHYTKRYGKVLACDDISFSLPDGSVTVLLGPNGAGKSTLMKGVIGFLRFDGKILVNGLSNTAPESRRMIGYIPEIPSFYPNLTVSEHMEFVARAYRLKDYSERAEALLERFSLSEHKKKLGSELSKGMAQKLNICLGLFTEPRVLLLDEPFIGLDPHAIKELKMVIEEQRDAGATLLVSTHIIDSVDMLWDRTVIMQNGTIRKVMTREELSDSGESLEDLFFFTTEGEASGGERPEEEASEEDA